MKATPERRRFLREKCIGMHVTLSEEFIERAENSRLLHTSRVVK